MCGIAQLGLYTQLISCNILLRFQSGLTHHFAWVSPVVVFKNRLFSNKHREVISNDGSIKVPLKRNFTHMLGKPPFTQVCCYPDFPQKVDQPTCT